jgi:hypothetical protein
LIPTPEQLAQLATLAEGQLAEHPFACLLVALAVHPQTAVIEIRRRQVWKRVFIEQGVPVDCRSNLAHETLGRYMVLEGKLSEDDFTACLSHSASRGTPLGEVLLERGLVSASELFKILQLNLAKKLLDLFTWSEGEFRRLEEDFASESSLKIKPVQLVLTGITRFAQQDEVDMAVGPLVGRRLALHPSPPFPLDEIRLNAHQSRMVDALRRGARMGELAEATGLPFDEITRLLYALSILQVAVPADQLPKGTVETGAFPMAAPTPPAQSPSAPSGNPAPPAGESATVPLWAPAAAPQPPPSPKRAADSAVSSTAIPIPIQFGVPEQPLPTAAEVERRRNEVMQAYLSYKRQDAFDLLGVAEDAPPALIEVRFLQFAHRFAPWTLTGHPELATLEERARDLFLAGARAFAELADSQSRSTLVYRRKTLREERSKKPASFAIKTDLLDSEAHYKKGKALLDAGKAREALVLLEFASDCDPQNSLYAAELAYCRFLHSSALAPKALRQLQELLRRDPSCGLAAYYAGEIERQLGNRAEAEDHLRRASKLMAPDRRPLDALRLLSGDKRR